MQVPFLGYQVTARYQYIQKKYNYRVLFIEFTNTYTPRILYIRNMQLHYIDNTCGGYSAYHNHTINTVTCPCILLCFHRSVTYYYVVFIRVVMYLSLPLREQPYNNNTKQKDVTLGARNLFFMQCTFTLSLYICCNCWTYPLCCNTRYRLGILGRSIILQTDVRITQTTTWAEYRGRYALQYLSLRDRHWGIIKHTLKSRQ